MINSGMPPFLENALAGSGDAPPAPSSSPSPFTYLSSFFALTGGSFSRLLAVDSFCSESADFFPPALGVDATTLEAWSLRAL
jgi:hypothetical protein